MASSTLRGLDDKPIPTQIQPERIPTEVAAHIPASRGDAGIQLQGGWPSHCQHRHKHMALKQAGGMGNFAMSSEANKEAREHFGSSR